MKRHPAWNIKVYLTMKLVTLYIEVDSGRRSNASLCNCVASKSCPALSVLQLFLHALIDTLQVITMSWSRCSSLSSKRVARPLLSSSLFACPDRCCARDHVELETLTLSPATQHFPPALIAAVDVSTSSWRASSCTSKSCEAYSATSSFRRP